MPDALPFILSGCFLSGSHLLFSAQNALSEGTTEGPGRFVCINVCENILSWLVGSEALKLRFL